jgi:hypothetical protein
LTCSERSECELRTAKMLCEHPCLHSLCYKPKAYRTLCLQVPSRLLDQDGQRTLSFRLDYNILEQDGRATILAIRDSNPLKSLIILKRSLRFNKSIVDATL